MEKLAAIWYNVVTSNSIYKSNRRPSGDRPVGYRRMRGNELSAIAVCADNAKNGDLPMLPNNGDHLPSKV